MTVDVAPEAPAGWNAFVARAEHGSFCHHSGWRRVFAEALGLDTVFLSVGRGEALSGALPLVRMPTLGGGRVLVSMPYLNYGGPIGTLEARTALAQAALDLARDSGDRRVELRCRQPLALAHAEADVGEAGPAGYGRGRDKLTVVLDLPDDAEVLFQDRFRAKLRSQVRRPMKEDMETRFGPDELGAFYGVFAENMRDLGTPVLPRRLFELLVEVFGAAVEFGAVYHEGRPVAAGCGFHWGDEFEMTWASSLRAYNRLSPNMLLYWRFMERCIDAGRTAFNFGRSTPGEGTHRFKSQWGGDDEPLHWLEWPEHAASPDADSAFFRLAIRGWRRLPLPVAGWLGPKLARRIPTF